MPVVRLGPVRKGTNDQETLYVEVLDTESLDTMHARLYDGTHVSLPERQDWLWHITCARDSRGPDQPRLINAAASLNLDDTPWTVDTVAYLELRGDRYRAIATWHIEKANTCARPALRDP